jgi:hypothetical protein
MPGMVTKLASKYLEFKAATFYLLPEDLDWLKQHARDLSAKERQPVSVTNVIRRIVAQYREKIERK